MIDPGQKVHVLVFRSQCDTDPLRAGFFHVRQQAAYEIRQEVGAQRPTGTEVSEHPEQVRHAGEHHASVVDGFGEVERLAVDRKVDVSQHAHVETGGGYDDIGLKFLAGLQQDAMFREPFDLVGDDRRFARSDTVEEVAVRDEGYALTPGAIAGREMALHIVLWAENGANAVEQFLLHLLRFFERTPRECGLVVQYLSPHNLVNPLFVYIQFTQCLGEFDLVAAGYEIGRRALQDGDVLAISSDRRHESCCRRA